ncbi:MAG TPA: hypothetical protein VF556_01910 [Pyrinomonadaceae bacterium]|jgi:hypothetical protein
MKKVLILTIILLGSIHHCLAQRVPILTYDDSGEQIISAFYLDNGGDCGDVEKPITAKVISASSPENGIDIKLGGAGVANFVKDFGDVVKITGYWELFPEHIRENLKTYLLRKGSLVKVWAAGCEGATVVFHIATVTQPAKQVVVPSVEESILLMNKGEAIVRIKELEGQIKNKIKQVKLDFDREIAPNISTGEKGEFETTVEYQARLTKLASLRQANKSQFWKKIYAETNSLVNEYLKLVSSFYASPVKVQLGKYDADKERFAVQTPIHNGFIQIYVPRRIAPLMKQKFAEAKAFIDFQVYFQENECKWFASPERLRVIFNNETFFDVWDDPYDEGFADKLLDKYSTCN